MQPALRHRDNHLARILTQQNVLDPRRPIGHFQHVPDIGLTQIAVDQQHLLARLRQTRGQIDGEGGFAFSHARTANGQLARHATVGQQTQIGSNRLIVASDLLGALRRLDRA